MFEDTRNVSSLNPSSHTVPCGVMLDDICTTTETNNYFFQTPSIACLCNNYSQKTTHGIILLRNTIISKIHMTLHQFLIHYSISYIGITIHNSRLISSPH